MNAASSKFSTFKHLVAIQSLKKKGYLLALSLYKSINHPEEMSTRWKIAIENCIHYDESALPVIDKKAE